MRSGVVVVGAGFGGMEFATVLSEELGADAGVTLIDRSDAFSFGFSKLDLLFGRATLEEIRLPYERFDKPGVDFRQETVTAIDPVDRKVTTDAGSYEAEYLVIGLGADYDLDATPGLAEAGNEFYSVAGAERLSRLLAEFTEGRVVVGVCDAPFKCPPAPSEAALLLHDYLTERGRRDACEIEFLIPFARPVPPSPETSAALIEAFAERDIEVSLECRVDHLDGDRGVIVLKDGSERPYDLFLGVPKHRAPDVVIASGMTEDGYIPVDSTHLQTRYPNVYAIGDVTTAGVPKAGVFAEGAGRAAARSVIATIRGEQPPQPYDGLGSCYIEFGGGRVGRVDVDFLSGPKPTGTYWAPSTDLVAEKELFGSSRRARWF